MAKRKIDFTLRDYWNQDSLLVYKEAVSRYPYCAPARLSFLLNLKALDDPDYERELAFTALAVPDRQRLQEEVRAAEQAAAVLRERGERRMRQVAARWAAASATTAALGRLMKTEEPTLVSATADRMDGDMALADTAAVPEDRPGREVDFKAVAANEPGLRPEAEVKATDETAAAWVEAEYPSARSRSSRRNARRMARREAQQAAEREAAAAMRAAEAVGVAETDQENQAAPVAQTAVGAVAESGLEAAAASLTISMLWAETPAAGEISAAAPHAAEVPQAPSRHRPEVFNPWAEVFTAKHTISDWLQEEDMSDAGTSAGSAAIAKPGGGDASARPAPARKPAPAGKKTVAAPKPVPGYIDPNELIDRFLRKNDDHILIQVDETRDYSAFDPDRGSLREDWSMGSETLAQLYLKQGAPDKAIEIYRYLGLKFPEKKRYFASLIRAAENAKGRK